MKILSKNEIRIILDRASAAKPSTFLKFHILAKTGVRVSELIKIRPVDILHDERQIIIHGKGGVIRNVDVAPEVLLPLRLFIKARKLKPTDRLFPVKRQSVNNLCTKYAHTNPHTFRHSYAVELLRKTRNIRYVQVQLGHKSLTTTQVYLRYMEFKDEKLQLPGLYE
jgi:integrase/recombinase XerC/integrase/recombinase XerD